MLGFDNLGNLTDISPSKVVKLNSVPKNISNIGISCVTRKFRPSTLNTGCSLTIILITISPVTPSLISLPNPCFIIWVPLLMPGGIVLFYSLVSTLVPPLQPPHFCVNNIPLPTQLLHIKIKLPCCVLPTPLH